MHRSRVGRPCAVVRLGTPRGVRDDVRVPRKCAAATAWRPRPPGGRAAGARTCAEPAAGEHHGVTGVCVRNAMAGEGLAVRRCPAAQGQGQ
jgi:hypothetical protein